MNRYLNIGIMQYEISDDCDKTLEKIKRNVFLLMNGMNRPEMILGPELCLGPNAKDGIPGKFTDKLGQIAKEYGIYFLPGSIKEITNRNVRMYSIMHSRSLDPTVKSSISTEKYVLTIPLKVRRRRENAMSSFPLKRRISKSE
jgi:predicted amidohydrolase